MDINKPKAYKYHIVRVKSKAQTSWFNNKPYIPKYHIYGVTHIDKNIRECKQFINSKIINDAEKIKISKYHTDKIN